jgi:hypothetical protein
MNRLEALNNLGKRVTLLEPIGQYPSGRSGLLVSIQAGKEPGANGIYVTVNFDLNDWSDEESVPLRVLRPARFGG